MRYCILFLILLLGREAEAHPLHLSVTNIIVDNGSLKISIKTFREDWEIAYFHYNSRVIDLKQSENRPITWIEEYIGNSFRISHNQQDNHFKTTIDTILFDEDNMTIEMSAELPDDLNSFYLYNSLLTDIFMDQTNLVIIGLPNKELGIKFDFRKRDEVVSLK